MGRGRIQIQGDLQLAIMRVMWQLGEANVDEVLHALPQANRGAYTTIQTVLNRLADRGLLERAREGRVIRYRPGVMEVDYLSRSLRETLDRASPQARQAALTRLIGEISPSDRAQIDALAAELDERRSKPPT